MNAVFDCNVFLQVLVSTRGAAHECWQRVLVGDVRLFVTPYMLVEIRNLPTHSRLARRFPTLTSEHVEQFVTELQELAIVVDDPEPSFQLPRDPADAHYVDVAIATGSMLVVSNDRDLLDLMQDTYPEGVALRRAHPEFRVVTPPHLLYLLRNASSGK